MDLNIEWVTPIELLYGVESGCIYSLPEIDIVPEQAGVYIFVRKYGETIEPLYIGKAINLKQRINNQFNNLKLMKGIENAKQGSRLLFIGRFEKKPKQEIDKSIRLIESALIDHCLSWGFDLLNDKGTKKPAHNLNFFGNRESTWLTGRVIKVLK